jgi:signal transduction histidine kinase
MGPNRDEGVDAIEREIDRMGIYLGELMSLGTGKPEQKAAWSPVKLSTLAESVLTIMAGRCRHLGIQVIRQFGDHEPEVTGDPVSLRQVIMNLVVNAIDAMPGGGTLTVRSRGAGEGVQFEVQDTGHGVQESGISIFDAFATSKPEGAGLGLYLSRQVIEAHAGVIAYENTTSGALFRIELPRRMPRERGPMRQDAKELVV